VVGFLAFQCVEYSSNGLVGDFWPVKTIWPHVRFSPPPKLIDHIAGGLRPAFGGPKLNLRTSKSLTCSPMYIEGGYLLVGAFGYD